MLAVCLFCLSAAASAQEASRGWDLFARGDYSKAISAATQGASADDYALICRSHMIIGGFQSEGAEAVAHLHQALEACEQSIALDPDNLVGRMTYAMAAGFEGKRLFSPGYASAAREHLEYLVDIYPRDPMTQAAIGGWHSEVAAAGFFARVVLGASRKKAADYFDTALKVGEPPITLRLEYAKFLARRGKKSREAALEQLDLVISSASATHFERLLQDRAARLRQAVVKGDKGDIKATIAAIAPYAGIEKWDDTPALKLAYSHADTTEAD